MGTGEVLHVGETPAAWLQREFVKRRQKNARYSLRAFANYLGIPPGRLCELMNEKRRFTIALAERAAQRLGLPPEEQARLLAQVTHAPFAEQPTKRELHADEFEAIADWQHFAILSLLNTASPPRTPKAISERLGISTVEARMALDRLKRLELVVHRQNRWQRTGKSLHTAPDVTAAALRRGHRQNLEQAIAALEEVPPEIRNITSLTLAIDPTRLPLARKMIAQFEAAMEAALETGHRTEVYNLNIQLVPVSKTRNPHDKT